MCDEKRSPRTSHRAQAASGTSGASGAPGGREKWLALACESAEYGVMKSIHRLARPSYLLVLFVLTAMACNQGKEPAPAGDRAGQQDRETKSAQRAGQETPAAGGAEAPVPPGAVPAPPDVAAPPADAPKTASGLATKVITPGTGQEHPRSVDVVKVNYVGWTTDGKMFDSSSLHGGPASFPLDRVIPGWTEGVQLMVAGEKRRMWIPEEMAYKGRPGAPQGMLVFDVELVSFTGPPLTPLDIAAPPRDAKHTKSGLAYKVLERGSGRAHPAATDTVVIQYSGWTADGKMFDSSIVRGEPTTLPMGSHLPPGLNEGLQLMVQGEKCRLWIPEELAYKGNPRAPQGMVVFDIELVSIRK